VWHDVPAELYRDAAMAFIGGLWLGLFNATAELRHARWLHALSLGAALGFSANSWLRSL
jgi:hypothetical protein